MRTVAFFLITFINVTVMILVIGWGKGRTNQVDAKLAAIYKNFSPKIKSVEDSLREKMTEVVEKKRALTDQARYLKTRLDSCIIYNGDKLKEKESLVTDIRTSVSKLTVESGAVKSMLMFNTEILRQKIIQDNNSSRGGQKSQFVSWSYMVRPLTDSELLTDVDYPALLQRLKLLRKYRGRFMAHLSNLLELREAHSVNLESSVHARQKLLSVLKKSLSVSPSLRPDNSSNGVVPANVSELGLETKSNTKDNSLKASSYELIDEIIEGSLENVFDHANCHDCTFVHSLTTECAVHTETLCAQVCPSCALEIDISELISLCSHSILFARTLPFR